MIDFLIEILLNFVFFIPARIVYLIRGESFFIDDVKGRDYFLSLLFWGGFLMIIISYRDELFS